MWQLVPLVKLTSAPDGVDTIAMFAVFVSVPGRPGIAEHPPSTAPSAANTMNLLMRPPVNELNPTLDCHVRPHTYEFAHSCFHCKKGIMMD